MKKLILTLAFATVILSGFAQGVAISSPASTPDGSAILDLKSANKGFLVPRMTAAAKAAIAFPASGLLIYQTDGISGFYYFNGIVWTKLTVAGEGDNMGNHSQTMNLATNNLYMSKYGTNMGIQLLDSGAVRILTDFKGAGYSSGTVAERFRFDAGGGFVAKGTLGIGFIPTTGAGERMMWHPYKAAFRAGSIGSGGIQWDDAQVGFYSTAFGYNTVALGLSSFVSGYTSYAMGSYSSALGYTCAADGTGAVALGYRCTANGDYSIAIGQRASANNFNGAMVLSDASTTDSTLASANNQFSARYAGGYRLFSNATRTVGVSLAAGGNSWVSISDSSRKENFEPASGETFLEKLTSLKLGSWNYKGQNPGNYRHYGPMAQEIFAAYGKDEFGIIGNDTTLASADMDGIMMILLQGLEKRTREQQERLTSLQEENAMLRSQLAELAELKTAVKQLLAASALVAGKEQHSKN